MTRNDAEQQYREAYRHYRAAQSALLDAKDAVYETRGIDYPYRGPMKVRVLHADRRLSAIEMEVARQMYQEQTLCAVS